MNADLTQNFSLPVPAAQLPDRFYLDMAIGTAPFEDICKTYELDPEVVRLHADDAVFSHRLLLAKQAVEDDGRAFKARCRVLAHKALPRLAAVVEDTQAPASAQIEAFKLLCKLGQLEPVENTQAQAGQGLQFTIIAPNGDVAFSIGPPDKPETTKVIDPPKIKPLPVVASPDEFDWVEA